MNTTLTIENLAPYLPYELTVVGNTHGDIVTLGMLNDTSLYAKGQSVNYGAWADIQDVKPALLPLSCLTEALPDGTVPIVELAKIAFPRRDFIVSGEKAVCTDRGMCFWLSGGAFQNDIVRQPVNQLALFQYLFKNHFDVFGLIESGLAIDKRTLINK